PVALLVRAVGREPRGARPVHVLLQPGTAGRVLRARPRRRGGMAGRRDDALDREHLRDAAPDGHLRARARQAPAPHAVAAEERPVPDREQRRGGVSSSTGGGLRAAVAAGVLGSGGSHRALLGAIVEVARAIFRAKASSILLLDEDTGELVFEAVSGEGEG